MRRLGICAVVALAVSAFAADAPVQPKASDETLQMKPDGQTVRGTIWLTNETAAAIPLSLSLGPFTIDSSRQIVPADVTITNPPSQIAPNQRLPIAIDAKNFWPGSGASAPLRNQGVTISTLHVVAVPFRIAPEGWKDNTPYPLRLRSEGGGRITLVNPDSIPYDVLYSLSVTGAKPISNTVKLQPESSTAIDLAADSSWFPCSGFLGALFREPESDATLAISAVVPTKGKPQIASPWPTRLFLLHVTRAYWPEMGRSIVSYLILLLLLALGGISSLILTNFVPNQTTKAQLQERLDALVGAVRNLPTSIDSGIRVATRVERLRIGNQLDSRSVAFADFTALAKTCEADITRLETVVALVHQIQAIYRDAYWVSPGFVPTLMETAVQAASEAEKKLGGAIISDADIAAARENIALANATLASAKTLSDEFRRDLSKRVAEVRAALTSLKANAFLQTALAGLKELDLKADYEDPTKLPKQCAPVDIAAVKLKILTDVAPIIEGFNDAQKAAMKDVVERMLGDLAITSLSQIRRAQTRARELGERKSVAELTKAIESGNFRLTVNPPTPKTGETALHRVELSDGHLRSAAIRKEVTCTWSFDDKWTEDGWQVAHYYEETRPYQVTVSFKTDTATLAAPPKKAAITITPFKVKQQHGFTRAQGMRLTLALLIAIVGLLSGAADQIAKLDLVPGMIAIFMIGFSADQIKNIIAK